MGKRLRIALLIESTSAIGRAIQHGIAAYARTHGPWSFYQQLRAMHETLPDWLKQRHCEGILARIESEKLLEQIRQAGLPTVDLLGIHELEDIPTVRSDHEAVARAAADELLSRGFRRFAFCGFPGLMHSDERCAHFVRRLTAEGLDVNVYRPARARRPANLLTTFNEGLLDEEDVAEWLGTLLKPVGLMAPNDVRAQQVLNACVRRDIAVPDEVAVIGVDNDEVLCELSDPPLSSVYLDGRDIGYQAALMLDQMINGQRLAVDHVRIKPRGVVVRQSTDVLAISDPVVARAMHFIRLHACEGIGVENVVEQAGLSRRTLERRFLKALGRSPNDEIMQVKLRRIKELLQATDFSLSKVASLTGFRYVESMHYFFKENAGQTPGQYRRRESRRP